MTDLHSFIISDFILLRSRDLGEHFECKFNIIYFFSVFIKNKWKQEAVKESLNLVQFPCNKWSEYNFIACSLIVTGFVKWIWNCFDGINILYWRLEIVTDTVLSVAFFGVVTKEFTLIAKSLFFKVKMNSIKLMWQLLLFKGQSSINFFPLSTLKSQYMWVIFSVVLSKSKSHTLDLLLFRRTQTC